MLMCDRWDPVNGHAHNRVMATKKRPRTLILAAKGKDGVPTIDGLIAMFRELTGREPTRADVAEARAILAEARRPPIVH